MSQALTLRATLRRAPRWTRIYLPSAGLDGMVETLWLFTLGWEASRAGWAAGLVLAAGSVPAVAFVLWGGSLADRLGAHRVAIWTMAGRILVMACWAAVVISDTAPAYVAAPVALAVGAISGIHDPAVSALPRLLVPQAGLEASTNAQRILVRLVQTFGPVLGGALAQLSGMGTVVVVAAALGLLPLAGFALLRSGLGRPDSRPNPAAEHDAAADHDAASDQAGATTGESGWQALLAGFGWIARDPAVRRTVPLQGVLNLTTASIIMAALPRLARIHGWGPEVFGVASGAFGGGLLAGSLAAFAIRSALPRRRAAVAVGCGAVSSVFVGLTGLMQDPITVVVAAGLMGLFLGPVGAILTGWTMAAAAASEPRMFGRVYAVLLLVTTAAEPLGYLIFTGLATATSVAVAAVSFGTVGLVVALIALSARPVRVSQAG